MAHDDSSAASTEVTALLWRDLAEEARRWIPTVNSLRSAHPDLELVVAGDGQRLAPLSGLREFATDDLTQATRAIDASWQHHVLIVLAPIVVPPGFLDRAVALLDDDPRVASVSFLSNAAGAFSVPFRNTPNSHQVESMDEVSITRTLRNDVPEASTAPIAVPGGAAVLLSRYALGALEGFDQVPAGTARFVVQDFALSASRRGFVHHLDASTYITRPLDQQEHRGDPADSPSSAEFGHLQFRHPADLARHEADKVDLESPLGLAVTSACVKVRGLRLIIDARDVGPKEMGTQVAILSLIRALGERADVAQIQVGLPGGVPRYAAPYLSSTKVRVFHAPTLDFDHADEADVIHRPSQPSLRLPFDRWRALAPRVVVTLQDLIAFQVGSYFASPSSWLEYRAHVTEGVRRADAIVTISEDTKRHVFNERLPVRSDGVFAIPLGTDHVHTEHASRVPRELLIRGFVHQEFLLVLGANYGHKNRDLAVRAWLELKRSFPDLALVLAGAFVPHGSSRSGESERVQPNETGLFVLPDVTTEERNWLLQHARVLLYPTSAEGFGFVPFEAATMGTPTVAVGFGPLTELSHDTPLWSTGWSPIELAHATRRLMEDPDLAAEQIRTVRQNSEVLTWSDTAGSLVEVYRTVLARAQR